MFYWETTMRLHTRLAALLVGAALFFGASTAKADFTLTITDSNSNSFTQTFSNATGSFNTTSTFGGYRFTGDVSSSGNSLSIDMTSIQRNTNSTGVAPGTFTYTLTKDGYTATAGSTLTDVAKSRNNWNAPDDSTTTTRAILGNGAVKTALLTFDDAGQNGMSSKTVGSTLSGVNLTLTGNISFTAGSPGPNTRMPFVSTATIHALPEPATVLMGLAGVPCMGFVVSMVRRRKVSVEA